MSSAWAWPVAWTSMIPEWTTSAPSLSRPSITLLTLPSLPGMAWLDRTTTSCSPSFNQRFSPRAISPIADIGSPCDPVEMMHTSPGSYRSMSSMSTSDDAGMSSTPSSRPSWTFFFMLSPSVATLRPSSIAAVAICWMRCRWLAKLAVMIRRSWYRWKSCAEHAADAGLARRVAGLLGVGRVAHQQPDPRRLGELADPGEVGAPAVDRGEVELPVAGVQHHALPGVDGDRVGVRDRVGDRDELDAERADLHDARRRRRGACRSSASARPRRSGCAPARASAPRRRSGAARRAGRRSRRRRAAGTGSHRRGPRGRA